MLGPGRMRVQDTYHSSTVGRSNVMHGTQHGVEWRSVTISGVTTASGRHPRRSEQFTDRTLDDHCTQGYVRIPHSYSSQLYKNNEPKV